MAEITRREALLMILSAPLATEAGQDSQWLVCDLSRFEGIKITNGVETKEISADEIWAAL